ncbi:DUF4359 domain-containing protein [Sulfobacillus harzensis]|uniref:DUF4359 domain-containing protein n=1 Tax=Sulfobacillus harzensis TaxID=2729629 RepID=A0A7Y0Q279_9FIRM|nr:DUF4359 domain-containing protein [Sulfobacillus harzensis]NMP20899.1 DUF4359 domain-containing protein [Sulfobacillus harzensis]
MRYLKWLIIAAAVLVLALTNPTMSQYSTWAVQMIEAHAGGLVGTLSTLFSGTIEHAVAANTVRHNYGVFSLYRTAALGHSFTVLGLFNHFILLSHH